MEDNNTGVIKPSINADTRVHTEQIKMQLDHKKETTELSIKFKEKIIAGLLSANFFVFIIIIAVVYSGFHYMTIQDVKKEDIVEYWKLILPVITTYIGYAIGKNSSD